MVSNGRRGVKYHQLKQYLGHNHIVRIGTTLQMNAQIRDHAMQIYQLAIGPSGFIQGRRIKSVAAVALYIACRVQTQPNNFMLIDFSDILGVRNAEQSLSLRSCH